jgi:DNA (cytosine-5)-methyltransferase 1
LDLYSGAGGAARGYQLAGWHVTGVDNRPQPRYAGDTFVQDDALEYFRWQGARFDAVHASPPCHDHSTVTGRNRKVNGAHGTGWMLDATVAVLADSELLWVVENVETATWSRSAYRIRLCGSSFGLDVRRHRWFATNVPMLEPACDHRWQRPRFRSLDSHQRSPASVVGVHGHLNYAGELDVRKKAMGIDWMTSDELSQAIPPAYTQFVGEHLLAHFNLQCDDPPGAAVPPTKTAAAPGHHHDSQGARFGTLRAPWGSVPNVPRQGGAT